MYQCDHYCRNGCGILDGYGAGDMQIMCVISWHLCAYESEDKCHIAEIQFVINWKFGIHESINYVKHLESCRHMDTS